MKIWVFRNVFMGVGVSNIVSKNGKWKNPKLTAISAPLCPYPPKLWSVVCSLCLLFFRCLTVYVFKKRKLQPYHPYSASVHPNCGQWSQRRSRGLIIEKLLFASSTAFLTFLLLIFHQIQSIENWILKNQFLFYIFQLFCWLWNMLWLTKIFCLS